MAPRAKPKATENSPAEVWSMTGFVIVTGPKAGRWRAGLRFGQPGARLESDKMTDDEKIAIDLDPELSVVPAPAEKKSAETEAPPAA